MRRTAAALLVLLASAVTAAEPRYKLYVTNSGGNDVTVIDPATNAVLTRIEVGPAPHGLAAPADGAFVLVTLEGAKPGQLLWIDPRTDRVTKRLDVGPAPNQLAVTPDGKVAYVPVADGHYEVVDLAAGKIVDRIRTGGRPHNTVCAPDGSRMYLAPMGDVKKVLVADVATHQVVGDIPFGDVVRPVTLSPDGRRLFANVDHLIGFEVADVAAGKKADRVEAELTDEQKKTSSHSHGIAVRPDGKELWMCDADHGQVLVFDLGGDRPRQTARIAAGGPVYWLAIAPDGKTCYVSVRGRNQVAVVDTATRQVTARIAVGKEPKRLLVVPVPAK